MKRLDNKVAIITGGASGIGQAAAIKFAQEGALVAVVDINKEQGELTVSNIHEMGGKAQFYEADVSNTKRVKEVIDEIAAAFGAINILYNNASVFLPDDTIVTEMAEEVWDKTIAVNLKSVFLFCKYTIPYMIKAGGGAVINTSSSCGIIGIPGCDAYSASKGATAEITRSLSVEYGKYNIRVNCLAPAAIMTPMLNFSNLNNNDFDEERFLKLRSPLRRYGTPEEVADIALFLASDEGKYLNGTVLPVDGGITINGDLTKIDKDYDN